ncbi:PREDICTED: coiled-coil domain-containing protein 146, partial [Acanthisitta chloris]|uniref:coiled-coil domain-containing protein 146 n=1 Tax=Acanthisitta chloris TaxID=57068 RepID=UPI0004F0DE6D
MRKYAKVEQLYKGSLKPLFAARKITDSRVAELMGQYTLLHKAVISLQELLQEAKCLSVELEQQQHELEKAEQFPEGSSSEVSQIRQQLLSCQSEYNAIKGREYEYQSKIECLQEEKRLLENEYERILKQKVNKKSKQLKESDNELCIEVIQRKAEIGAIKEAISSKQQLIISDEKETKKLLEKQGHLKDELVKILDVTKLLGKETEKIIQKKKDAEKQNETLNDQTEELIRALKATDKRKEEILQEQESVMKELNKKQILLESKEREFIALTKLLEISREKVSGILSDREVLEEKLKKCALEKEKQHNILIHKQTQKDRELRNLKKMELKLGMIYDSLEQDKSQHKALKSEAETISKSNEELLERRRELQKEIEMIKRSLAEQERMSDMDARVLEKCIAEEQLLFKEQEKCRSELSRLAHLTWLRDEERQEKSRDAHKAQIQLQNIIKEMKRKDREIRDCNRRKKEIQNQLQGFAKMCDLIHKERDKCISLANAARWKTRKTENQVELLQNELGNLRTAAITKERKLQERHLKIKNNVTIIEHLKTDCCKMVQVMHEMEEKIKHRCLNLERLTTMVNCIKEEIVQLHKKHEKAIQQQKESDLLLRKREEVLGLLHARIEIQEMMCRNRDTEVQILDEEIQLLKLKVAEEKRQITQHFKEFSVRNARAAHLVGLQTQYLQCKDRIRQMEEIFADATNESRKQEMGGKDPSPPELLKKIEQLEAELMQKEEKVLKMDLLCGYVSWLTDRICTAAENRRQPTLLLARR